MKKTTTIFFLILSISLFSQTNCDITNSSTSILGAELCSENSMFSGTLANDIIVPADYDMTLTAIMPCIGVYPDVTITSAIIKVYNNVSGLPGGTPINSQTVTPISSTFKGNQFDKDFSYVLFNLDPVFLPGSAGVSYSYWISIQVNISANSGDYPGAYMEVTYESFVGEPITFSSGGGFVVPNKVRDGVYTFYANCEPKSGVEFPYPYCGPLAFGTVEPITLVEVAGISNSTSALLDGSPGHEDFTHIVGEMGRGMTYPITLKGNTVDAGNNRFVVFIDWNQNNVLDDAGEVYVIDQVLNHSTGTDAEMVKDDIVVPFNALLGTTRMRVKKTYNGPFVDPCVSGSSWGQAEDYTIKVTEGTGISENNELFGFSFYPNPSSDIVYLQSAKNIESVSLYNLLGQEVLTAKVGSAFSNLDVSCLSAGTYIMKVIVNGEMGAYKFLKQ